MNEKVRCIKKYDDSGLFGFQHYGEIGTIGAITQTDSTPFRKAVTLYHVRFTDSNIHKLLAEDIELV